MSVSNRGESVSDGTSQSRGARGANSDEEVFDGEARLGRLLDLELVLVLEPVRAWKKDYSSRDVDGGEEGPFGQRERNSRVEDVRNIPLLTFLLDPHHAWIDARLHNVSLAHLDGLLARLVRNDIDPAVDGARQDARDKARAKHARRGRLGRERVEGLEGGRKEGFEGGDGEGLGVALVEDLGDVVG